MFNTIRIQIPARFFIDIDKLILKCIWLGTHPKISKTILTQKNKRNYLPDLKAYYRAIVIKKIQLIN